MDVYNVLTIIISVMGSSIVTLCLSTFLFNPINKHKEYIFHEKITVYNSLVAYMEICIRPKESRIAINTNPIDMQHITDEERKEKALDYLKSSLSKIKLITKNIQIYDNVKMFVSQPTEELFENIIFLLQKDLCK